VREAPVVRQRAVDLLLDLAALVDAAQIVPSVDSTPGKGGPNKPEKEIAAKYFARANTGQQLLVMAQPLWQQGRFAEAIEKAEREYRMLCERDGAQSVPALWSAADLSGMLSALGDHTASEQMLDNALRSCRTHCPENKKLRAVVLGNLGLTLKRQDKLDAAELMMREGLQLQRELTGESSEETCSQLNNVGMLLHAKGKYKEAVPFLRQALSKCRMRCGDSHPSTLNPMNNLALVLHELNELDEATSLYHEALRRKRETLGDAHPSTLTTMNNLGGAARPPPEPCPAPRPCVRACTLNEATLSLFTSYAH
jgi:tetratricopeptide (TPR) repeat protein